MGYQRWPTAYFVTFKLKSTARKKLTCIEWLGKKLQTLLLLLLFSNQDQSAIFYYVVYIMCLLEWFFFSFISFVKLNKQCYGTGDSDGNAPCKAIDIQKTIVKIYSIFMQRCLCWRMNEMLTSEPICKSSSGRKLPCADGILIRYLRKSSGGSRK